MRKTGALVIFLAGCFVGGVVGILINRVLWHQPSISKENIQKHVLLEDEKGRASPKEEEYAPPEYIKEIGAYKEGYDGIMIYVILADKYGRPTAADGILTLTILEEKSKWDSFLEDFVTDFSILYQRTLKISKDDFVKATIGMGPFERETLLYPIGRVPYSHFKRYPKGDSGRVIIEFLAEGKELKGEESILF